MSKASLTPSRIGTITFFETTIPYAGRARRAGRGFSLSPGHVGHRLSLSMIRFPTPSTVTENPGWTTVVESNSSTTAGPASVAPAASE